MFLRPRFAFRGKNLHIGPRRAYRFAHPLTPMVWRGIRLMAALPSGGRPYTRYRTNAMPPVSVMPAVVGA